MLLPLTDFVTTVLAFAATNIDDLFVLLAFFADPRYRMSHVIAGQYLGIAALVAASVVTSLLSLVVQPAWLGLLGLVPMALGIKALFDGSDADQDEGAPPVVRTSTVLAVASVTIANGADNLGVYIPWFATLSMRRIVTVCLVFGVLIAVWCDLARRMVRHPSWGPPIHRYGARSLPYVFIGLGIWILIDMGTVGLLR